jgi:hypothetical protein
MIAFVTVFIFGLLAAFFAVIVEIATSVNPLALTLGTFRQFESYADYLLSFTGIPLLILIAGIEELSRYVFLRQYALRFIFEPEALTRKQKALLGIFFGLGFSSLEIFLLFQTEDQTPLLPLSGIVLVHVVLSVLFAFSLLRNTPKRTLSTLLVLGLAILFHTLYNLAIVFLS